MKQKKYQIISLGCAKNTVDSESIAQLLDQSGYSNAADTKSAEILIVNTCGFIDAAREESYSELQHLAEYKNEGQILIAAGCLTQRFGAEVAKKVPGIDGILGTRRWMDIIDLIEMIRKRETKTTMYHLPTNAETVGTDEKGVIRTARFGASAYLKIADGCRRPCAFCSIPLIKGKNISRPLDDIIRETQLLTEAGTRELILIAQDTTDYGQDLELKNGLVQLLDRMAEVVPEDNWIRIMYAYPGYVTDELIATIANNKQILPYIDIPLQHGHPDTLKRMRRPANINWVHETIGKLRNAMPELAIRTTFIVGYPGETEQEFQTLLDFIEEIRFDRLGAFAFSFEPGTYSEALGDPIPEEVKLDRQGRLMEKQQQISLELNQAQIGKTLDVLIEGLGDIEGTDEKIAVGRTYRDAPEIDGIVLVEGQPEIGQIIPVEISTAMTYDLIGKPADPFKII
jgi:ribosomal protein S12 methylthiotransferase